MVALSIVYSLVQSGSLTDLLILKVSSARSGLISTASRLRIPIASPMAVAMGLYLPPVIGALLSGWVFGDHCSPISDTTIISSMASASDHIDHVRTQLPYALLAGAVSTILFLIAGLVMY